MKLPRFFSPTVVVLFGVIVLMPIGYMIAAPFGVEDLKGPDGFRALFEVRQLILAKNSLGLALGVTGLSLAVGVPLAFLIQRTNLCGRRLFRILCVIPILIPPYIHAIVWTHLNQWIKQHLSLPIHSIWGAILVLTLAYYPFVTLTTSSGLRSVDRNLEETSLLTHGRWHTLSRITLPLISPHIFAGGVFVFIFSIVDFSVADILRVKVYPIEIFIQFSALYDEGAAVILSLPLIGITLSLLVLQKWYMKDRSYIQVSGGEARNIIYDLGWFHILAFGFMSVVAVLSVGLPLVLLLKMAGPLSTYLRVLGASIGQIGYSLVLATLSSMLALLLAFSLSYLIDRAKINGRAPLSFAVFIPLAIPATTLGIGLIKIWNHPLLDLVYGSSWIIIFGYIARFIPFAAIIITSGLKQVSPRLEEAAFLTTPQWTRVIRRIVTPLTKHSIAAAFFFVFILSIGELGTTLLVIPPGRETIPIKIYNLMHYGAEQMVAALCLILILVVLAFSGLLLIFHKKTARTRI